MRTSRRVGADPLGRGLGDRPDGDRVVVRARGPADQLLQQRVGDVAQLEQADPGDDAEARSRRTAGCRPGRSRPSGPSRPARGCRCGSGRSAGPARGRWPRSGRSSRAAAVAPTLISLVRVRTSLSVSTPAAVPPITTRKWAMPVPSARQVSRREAEGDHQGEVGVVGDRQDHRRDGHRDRARRSRSGWPAGGPRPMAATTRPQIVGDPPEVAGDPAARAGRRSSRSERTGPRPGRGSPTARRRRVAEAQVAMAASCSSRSRMSCSSPIAWPCSTRTSPWCRCRRCSSTLAAGLVAEPGR